MIWVRTKGNGCVDISKATQLIVVNGGEGFWHVNADSLTLQSFESEEKATKYLESLMGLFPVVLRLKG